MPTFNQLVRKGRQTAVKKSTAPALQKGFNSLKKRSTDESSPQKRGDLQILLHRRREVFVQQLKLQLRKNLTQLLEKLPEFVFLTVSK